MMNPTKANNIFLGVPFIWGFMLMNVGLGKNPTSEIKIGIVLDLQTPFSKICLTSINMSLSDFYENHSNYTTRIAIHVRDSLEDAVQASAAGLVLFCLSCFASPLLLLNETLVLPPTYELRPGFFTKKKEAKPCDLISESL